MIKPSEMGLMFTNLANSGAPPCNPCITHESNWGISYGWQLIVRDLGGTPMQLDLSAYDFPTPNHHSSIFQ